MDSQVRRLILRRRALLLSATLSVLGGCTSTGRPAHSASTPGRTPAAPVPTTTTSGAPSTDASPPPPTAPTSALSALIQDRTPPRIEIPGDASDDLRALLVGLEKTVEALHETLTKTESLVPGDCDLNAAPCKSAYQALVSQVADIAMRITALEPPCGFGSQESEVYPKLVRAQQSFLRVRLERIRLAVEETLPKVRQPEAAAQAAQALAKATQARRSPCLFCRGER